MQKENGCIWFGHPNSCLVYNIILPALILAAMGDFMVSVGMIALGTEVTRMTKWKERCSSQSGLSTTLGTILSSRFHHV